MKINNIIYSNPKQAVLPMLIQDYLDICDPVLTFDRFMGEIELEKYLKNIPQHYTGRLRYDPVSMLKTVLFGFMANGYISLRKLEDQCKINLRFMYLSSLSGKLKVFSKTLTPVLSSFLIYSIIICDTDFYSVFCPLSLR